MAGDLFQGLTIRIGADTKRLTSALGQVSQKAASTQKTLRALEQALKLDPSNVVAANLRVKTLGESAQLAAQKASELRIYLERLKSAKVSVDGVETTMGELAASERRAYVNAARITEEYNTVNAELRTLRQNAVYAAEGNELTYAQIQKLSGAELKGLYEQMRSLGGVSESTAAKVDELDAKWESLAQRQSLARQLSGMEGVEADIQQQESRVKSLADAWYKEGAAAEKALSSPELDAANAQIRRYSANVEEASGRLEQMDSAALSWRSVTGMTQKATAAAQKYDAAVRGLAGSYAGKLSLLAEKLERLGVSVEGVDSTSLADLRIATERAAEEASSAKAAYDRLDGEIAAVEKRVSELRAAVAEADAAGGIADADDVAELEKCEEELRKLEDGYDDVRRAAERADDAYNGAAVAQEYKETELAAEKATVAQNAYRKSARAVNSSAADAAYHVRSLGTAFMAVSGAAVSMGLYAIVDAADDVDSAYRDMRKTVEATEEEYEELKDAAIEFSQTHVTSADEVLEIEAMGGQLGIAAENLDSFATVISNLDVATDIDAEDAAEDLGKLAGIMDLDESEYEKFGDSLVRLGNNFAAMESDVIEIVTRFAGMGATVDMSADEMLGWATAASTTGMKSEAAGSAMQRTISKLENAVAEGGDSLDAFASVSGMSADEFAEKWEEDPSGAMQSFVEGLAAVDANGGSVNKTLTDLGITNTRDKQLLTGLAKSTDTLSDALGQSADAWEDGGDAEEEAAKKAEGFSGQLSILKNNLQALASEAGEALAPAVSSIGGMVADLAEWFGDLSESQQQAVLGVAGVVAAMGPVLTIGGAVGQVVGRMKDNIDKAVLSQISLMSTSKKAQSGLLGVRSASDVAAASQGALGKKAQTATTQLQAQTAKTKALKTALAGLKAGAAIVAGIIVGKLVESIVDYNEKVSAFEKANTRIEKSLDGIVEATEDSSDAVNDTAEDVAKAADIWDDYADAQEDCASSIETTESDYQTQIAELDDATSALSKYVGKTDLTTSQQGELRAAVELVNDACGTEFEVVDAANGKISGSKGNYKEAKDAAGKYKDKILEVVDAQKDLARTEALTETLKSLYSEQTEAAQTYADAIAGMEANYDPETGKATSAEYWDYKDIADTAADQLEVIDGQIASVETEIGDAGAAAEDSTGKVQHLYDVLGGEQSSEYATFAAVLTSGGDYSTDDFISAIGKAETKISDLGSLSSEQLGIVASNFDGTAESIDTGMVAAIADGDSELEGFIGDMSKAGTSTGTLATIGSDNLAVLNDACGGNAKTASKLVKKLESVEGLDLSDKTFEVGDDGSIQIQAGKLTKLQKQELRDKGFKVSDEGTITIERGRITNLNSSISSVPEKKTTTFFGKVSNTFTNAINAVKKALSSITGNKTVSVGGNAAGGYFVPAHASGGYAIPEHADGGIVTTASLTRHGIVGEAGAEAIIPLENKRYAQPFVDNLVEGLREAGAGSSTSTTNITVNGVTAAPASQLYALAEELVEAALTEAARRS